MGIAGLKNKSGQGRKTILNKEAHELKVKEIVKSECQRLNQTKSLIEKELEIKMSKKEGKLYFDVLNTIFFTFVV